MHDTTEHDTTRPIDTATPQPGPTGPAGPQPWVEPPQVRLPRRSIAAEPACSARLWWVGVHGGAGESTLAALLPGSRAAGHAWPELPSPSNGWRTPVVLMARSNIAGLTAAGHAATEWAAGALPSVQLLGLVVVADAPGRFPRPLRDLTALVAGGVPRCWVLPWVEAWRTEPTPDSHGGPHQLRALLRDLSALTGPGPATPVGRRPAPGPARTDFPAGTDLPTSTDLEGVPS